MPGSIFNKIAVPTNISTYLSRTLIIVTVATTLLIGSILIFQQTYHYKKISKQKSNEYIEDQKIYIQEIVKNELEYIRLQNEVFKETINNKVKQNVTQAYFTAESIYHAYSGKKSDEEIKALIIATISSLKFDMEYEEVFISSLDGNGVFYPRKPEFTGKNMRQFTDANGTAVVTEELKLLKEKEEGFLNYNIFPKLEKGNVPHKKITFVKKFGHFNWYFGSKQYVEDYFPKFREEIAQKISSVRFRYGGYVFMNQTNGVPIVINGSLYKGDLNLLTNADSARHQVFLKQLNTIKNFPDGGYFYYKWNKINEIAATEKCSYVKLFKDYNWIIGAGFYLDEIQQSIQEQQALLRKEQRRSIITILIILFLLLFIEAMIIYRFNKRYKSDFERFFNFFYSSQSSFKQLNIAELNFDEFKQAGAAANKMIIRREEIEKKLIEEQERAKESDRLKSAFLSNMSHEIRTPMNAIIGFSELMEDNTQDEQDKAVFIKLIRKNGDILLNLINDIIDISKIEANLLSVKRRPVQLNNFLNEINSYYIETLSKKKGKDIQFHIQSKVNPDISILTDEIRLRQILDNLIGNAIKFTTSGSVFVDVKMEGELLHFSIKDTGIGIPTEQQSTIFERFIQAEQDHKLNFGGTGLGLAISKNLINLLGGNIYVKSEPGKGSIFYFHISAN